MPPGTSAWLQQSALPLAPPQVSASPTQDGGGVHAPHEQLALQVSVPPPAHPLVLSAGHAPSPAHVDHADHVPLLHVRLWLPQLPHACVVGPEQVWPVHVPH